MKEKAFFITSKGFSIKQITQNNFLEGESPTLIDSSWFFVQCLELFNTLRKF